MIFEFPMPPNLTNGRYHWRTLQRRKVAFKDTCDTLQVMGSLPKPPLKPWPSCTVRGVLYLGAKMDTDNLLARCKWPMDWLQSRGYIANDRDARWLGIPEQVIRRGQPYRVVLTLEPV